MKDPAGPDREDEDLELHDDPGLDIEVLRHRREVTLTVLALALILGVTVFLAHKFLRTPPSSPADLAPIVQQAIRQAMPGISVQIGGADEMRFKIVSETIYDVTGRFYAVSADGRLVYYVFECSMEQADNNWRPKDLTLTPLF